MTVISNEWKAIRTDVVTLDELGTGLLDEEIKKVDDMIKELEGTFSSGNITDMLRFERRRFTDPFFYQDEQHSFLVEPTLTEKTIIEWDDWVIHVPQDSIRIDPKILEDLPIEVNTPAKIPFPPEPDPEARFRIKDMKDWVTDPLTVLVFDDRFIGKEGGLDLKLSESAVRGRLGTDSPVVVGHSSEILSGGIVANTRVESGLSPEGLSSFTRSEVSVNIVSSSSMNPALLRGLGTTERRRLVTRGGGNI
jgi:hypothetical protein